MSPLWQAPPPAFTLPDEWRVRLQPLLALPGAYLFGGALRDFLLHRPAKDYDLLLPSPVAAAARSAAAGATLIPLDAARDIYRVVWPGGATLDLKGYADLDAEIHQSDFTVNALMVCGATGAWDDRVGGFGDLRRNLLRAVSATAFGDDPLRVLRAVRFAAQLGLVITPKTDELLRAALPRLAAVAQERVADELRLLANDRNAATAWRLLALTGALDILFPVLTPARGCAQNDFHHLDVLDHALEAARCWTEEVLPVLTRDPAWQAYFAEPLGQWARQGVVALQLLLHDADKPATVTADSDERRHFYDHEVRGAALLD
ncbi:MAG TPA: hypothetical protein PKM88_09540, partial [bacterium]|nr:hypothetical protein [bacterium]